MKKLALIPLFIFCLWIKTSLAFSVHAQALIPQVSFNTANDIRSQAGTPNAQALLLGIATMTDNNGGVYRWDATSTAADDGFVTFAVIGVTTGRWVRVANGNTLKGSFNLSGTALQSAYPVTYTGGVTLPYVPSQIYTQPTSQNAAVVSWVTNITTTGFTINFTSVPVVGTNNLTGFYLVIKQ